MTQPKARQNRSKAKERLTTKTTTKGDPAWTGMMEFFKANPAALMDALPTPPGSDVDEKEQLQNSTMSGFDTSLRKKTKAQDLADDRSDTRSVRSYRSNVSGVSHSKRAVGIYGSNRYQPKLKRQPSTSSMGSNRPSVFSAKKGSVRSSGYGPQPVALPARGKTSEARRRVPAPMFRHPSNVVKPKIDAKAGQKPFAGDVYRSQ